MTPTQRSGTRLTDAKLRAIQPKTEVLTDSVVRGLMFKPSLATAGSGTWLIRYYNPDCKGQRVKLKIGNYPSMGLEEARMLAKRLLSSVAQGQDARKVLQEEQAGAQEVRANTLERLTLEFYNRQIEAQVWRNARYAEQWLREMRNHVFPRIGQLPVAILKTTDIVDTLKNVWRNTPDTGKKLLNRLNQVLAYSRAKGVCEHNPCPDAQTVLGKQVKKPKNERRLPAMPWQDVPRFVAEVLLSGTPAQSKRALLFLILNAARSGAVRNLTFEEIDFEQAVWTMQAHALERKTNVTRYYPLSRQSLKLLYFQQQHRDAQHMSCPLVFPARKANKKDSWALSDMTLTALLRDHTADFTADISTRTPTAHGFRTAFKG